MQQLLNCYEGKRILEIQKANRQPYFIEFQVSNKSS